MRYQSLHGWKYRLYNTYSIETGITGYSFETYWLRMEPSGKLTITEGYCWDGATMAIDTQDIMRGSLVHDGLYQCIRIGLLPPERKDDADKLLMKICREDGMSKLRSLWIFNAVRLGGGFACDPECEPDNTIYDTEVLCKRKHG